MIGILFMVLHGLGMLVLSFGFLMLAIYMAKYVSKEILLKVSVICVVLGLIISCIALSAGVIVNVDSTNIMGNQYDGKGMMNRDNNSDEEKVEDFTTSSTVEN